MQHSTLLQYGSLVKYSFADQHSASVGCFSALESITEYFAILHFTALYIAIHFCIDVKSVESSAAFPGSKSSIYCCRRQLYIVHYWALDRV